MSAVREQRAWLRLPEDPARRGALLVCAGGIASLVALILLAGESPARVLVVAVHGSLISANGIADTIVRAIPLCLMGLGIAIAFRAGVFNIGGDGQIIMGAAAGVALAPALSSWPAPLGLAVLVVAGLAGGAAWGGIAGGLKARFGANEIIATIMLNYIAFQALSWFLRGPLQESMGVFPRSDPLDGVLRLPVLVEGTRISAGLVIALAVTGAVWLLVSRMRLGYALTVIGLNPGAARYGGIKLGHVRFAALTLSGALAGLAGIVEVAGRHGRLEEGFAAGVGITGIAVALLARLNPAFVPIAAVGFAALHVGSAAVARVTAVPFPLVYVVEATVIFMFLAVTLLGRDRGVQA